jgi:hypothetical protein
MARIFAELNFSVTLSRTLLPIQPVLPLLPLPDLKMDFVLFVPIE